MDSKSLNLTAEKLEQLRALFPEVFSEGKVDFARLKDILGENVAFPNEHYELSWAGKTEARKEIQKQTTATLVPDKEGSVNFGGTENIFIEGENLEVLRILQKSYFGKVKMIYIDPPYNTGNDSFVYPDDYAERLDEYNKRTGTTDDEGYLNKQDLWRKNSRDNGQFHSVWLSMMYPRLYLARNLLREDGVIFVSIDDNEVSALKLLMDEVFGAENFIDCIIWKKRYGGGAKEKYLVTLHEYVLFYAKDINSIDPIFVANSEESINRYYKLKDEHFETRGGYRTHPLEATKSMGDRPNLVFPIIAPDGTKILPKRQWLWSKDRVEVALSKGEIAFLKDKDDKWSVHTKQYLKDEQGIVRQSKAFSIIEDVFTQHGTNEIIELFGNAQIFPFPKPTAFISKLLSIGTDTDEEHIILDFFTGSGATAQAMLQVNEDAGNRKFICVQLPEPLEETSEAYKAGYRTIADIGKSRIQKVVANLQATRAKELPLDPKQPLGFNSFKLAPSNFKAWRGDVEGEELLKQMEVFRQSEKDGSVEENMLVELVLKSGLSLTSQIETVKVGEQNVYLVEEGKLLVFFETYNKALKDFIREKSPKQVVCLDSVFKGRDEDLSNFKLELKEAGIELTVI